MDIIQSSAGGMMMNPSLTLGTFLRYWRSEWACLTRAQLALAVAAQCDHGRKHVTEAVVRAWEKGQPPADTEELDALLAVMRRHGLTEPEISSVRRAVFAACLDRHYPELFAAEEFALQEDVDEQAEGSLGEWPQAPASHDLVGLVGRLQTLESEVGRDVEPARAGSQRRRQQVALAFTRETMAWYLAATNRLRLTIAQDAAKVRFLRDCFGPRGVGKCTLRGAKRDLLQAKGYLTKSEGSVLGMLELSREAELEGDEWRAATAYSTALNMAPGELREALWPAVPRHLANTPTMYDDGDVPTVWDKIFEVAVADGKWEIAEQIAPVLERWREGGEWQLQYWHRRMGPFAFYRGDLSAAEDHFITCLRMNEQLGGTDPLQQIPAWLRACEDAARCRRRKRTS